MKHAGIAQRESVAERPVEARPRSRRSQVSSPAPRSKTPRQLLDLVTVWTDDRGNARLRVLGHTLPLACPPGSIEANKLIAYRDLRRAVIADNDRSAP